MASLEGLPPLPKSLSGLNLLDYHAFESNSSPYSLNSDNSTEGRENHFNQSYSLMSETGNFFIPEGRTYSMNSTISSGENIILGRTRATPPLRDVTPSLNFKQITETSPITSTRASPVVNSSRNTPHGSSRESPVVVGGSTPPVPALRGTTSPMPGLRGLTPPTPPPRQSQLIAMNGLELSCSVHSRTGHSFNLDAQLAILRKEMFSLRQLDLSLLNQLWSLNEALQDFRNMQEENAALLPSSPGSCEDSDEFYGPVSSLRYQNISNFRLSHLSSRLSSSSESSIEFGDV